MREVREETGLDQLPLGPEVWRRRHVFMWRGVESDQRERRFVARMEHFEADAARRTATEKADLTACRWWSVEELDATEDVVVPRDLATRLRTLLADGPPASPVDVGV